MAREFGGETAGVIVVDNSPGDGAAASCGRPSPTRCVITNPVNRGYAAAVNQALATRAPTSCSFSIPTSSGSPGAMPTWSPRFAIRAWPRWSPGTRCRRQREPNCFRAPRPFDLISEDVALADRFPRWQRPRRYRMLDWDHRDARQVDAATGACLFLRRSALADVGAVRRALLRLLRGDGLDGPGEAPRMANRLRPDGRGRACLGRELAGRTVAPVAVAPREPAPVRPQALRAHHDGAPSGRRSSASTPPASPGTRSAATVNAEPAAADRIRLHITMRAPHPSSGAVAISVRRVRSRRCAPADWGSAGRARRPRLRHARVARARGGVTTGRRAPRCSGPRPPGRRAWWRSCRCTCGGRHGVARPSLRRPRPERPARARLRAARRPGRGRRRRGAPIAAIPLRPLRPACRARAGDHRFGQRWAARPLYADRAPVLRFEEAIVGRVPASAGRNFRQQVRRFPAQARRELGRRYRTASPSIPSARARS